MQYGNANYIILLEGVIRVAVQEATINVRINAALKERGDKILRDYGLSTSEVVRLLWDFLAQEHRLPAFLQEVLATKKNDDRERKRKALDGFVGIAASGATLTDEEIDELHLQSMMDDYRELS